MMCSIEGCGKSHFGHGWCQMHYKRWRKHSDPARVRPQAPPCSVEGCTKPSDARGWCKVHYNRWKRHGDPLAGGTGWGEPHRFYHDVALAYEGDECLIWPFSRHNKGYAQIRWNGRTQYVSRLLCEDAKGPPPSPDHEAAHDCGRGTQSCVTKKHLVWKTHADNISDKLAHGTTSRGEKSASAILTEALVLQIRNALSSGARPATLARQFGVSHPTICDIRDGRRWSHLTAGGDV